MSAKYRIGRLETTNPVALNIPNALPMHFQIAGMMSPSMVGSLEATCYFVMAGRKLIRGFFRQMYQFHKPRLEFCRFQNVSYHTYQLEHADLFQEFVAPKIRQLWAPI